MKDLKSRNDIIFYLRTGTFIAIDALYEEGQKTGIVSIAEYVTKMRETRMKMVQTYVKICIETLNVLFNTRNMWKLHVFVSSWSSIVEYVKKKFITLTSDKTICNTIFTNGIMYYENHYLLTGTIKDNISDSVWNV